MSLENELQEIEKKLGDDPQKYHDLLWKLKIESTVTPTGVSILCPKCITKRRSINIRIKENKYDRVKWRCYGCDDNPHFKYFDNLVGLIRFFHPELSPREVINLMKDKLYEPLNEAPNISIPFGKYKDQPITEVPYSYLEWLVAGDILKYDPYLRDQLIDYLYGSTIPAHGSDILF